MDITQCDKESSAILGMGNPFLKWGLIVGIRTFLLRLCMGTVWMCFCFGVGQFCVWNCAFPLFNFVVSSISGVPSTLNRFNSQYVCLLDDYFEFST